MFAVRLLGEDPEPEPILVCSDDHPVPPDECIPYESHCKAHQTDPICDDYHDDHDDFWSSIAGFHLWGYVILPAIAVSIGCIFLFIWYRKYYLPSLQQQREEFYGGANNLPENRANPHVVGRLSGGRGDISFSNDLHGDYQSNMARGVIVGQAIHPQSGGFVSQGRPPGSL